MTNPDDVSFDSFTSDKKEYTIGKKANLSGRVNKGQLSGIKLHINITKPDNTLEPLVIFVTDDGYFETPYTISEIGEYKAKAKYLKAESTEIKFLGKS